MKMKVLIILLAAFAINLTAQTESGTTSLLQLKSEMRNISPEFNPIIKYSDEQTGKKSGFTAILYSLLLPGMGELYAGNYDRGKYFTIAEGVFWGFYAGFNIYGNWQKNNYKSFAVSYAGVTPEGKDDDYYADISGFVTIDEFNRQQSLERNFADMYDADKYHWDWKTVDQRRKYRDMWISSEEAFNNVRFAAGALVLNRIVSAINAALIVRSHNKKLSSPDVSFYMGTDERLSCRLGVIAYPF